MNSLTPQRRPDETYDQYRVRRAVGNKLVKRHIRGRLAFGYVRVPHNRAMRKMFGISKYPQMAVPDEPTTHS